MFSHFWKTRKFRVLIKGHNVLLRDVDTGVTERLGFFTTRFVKARDEEAAEQKARTLVADAVAAIEPLNDPADGPTLDVEEIEEVDEVREVKGFTFFPESGN